MINNGFTNTNIGHVFKIKRTAYSNSRNVDTEVFINLSMLRQQPSGKIKDDIKDLLKKYDIKCINLEEALKTGDISVKVDITDHDNRPCLVGSVNTILEKNSIHDIYTYKNISRIISGSLHNSYGS